MNYVVLDIEWNSPERKHHMIRSPSLLHGEIIQIGAVKLNEDLDEIDSFEKKVRPKHYIKVNREVQRLTGITYDDLANEKSFEEVIEDFRSWCGQECILLTWGPSDIDILKENCEIYEMDPSWIPEYFDAQLMFDDLETMEGRQFSLDYAVYYFGIKGNKAHDALNDAKDTTAVIRNLDYLAWIEEERQWRAEKDTN